MKTNQLHKKTTLTLALGIITSMGITSCNERTEQTNKTTGTAVSSESANKPVSYEEKIKRGEYIVRIAGCGDCHSPKVVENGIPHEDPSLLLSGHPEKITIDKYDKATAKNWVLFNMHNTAAVGPWGVSFAANLTSDATGIGNWTEEQFMKAMKEGKYKGMEGTRPLLPPMPWPNYSQMTNEDLSAVFAFLKTTKPVTNVVPAAIPPGN